MKKLILLILISIIFVSCNSNSNKDKPQSEKKEVTVKANVSLQKGCYSYKDSSNYINLEITEQGQEVEGKLTYSLDGKDSNTGTIKGQLTGDKLICAYKFLSEGVESVREVAFMVKDNKLIEGYGALNESGTAFKDRNAINYSSTMPLSKTDCSQSKEACQYKNGKAFSNLNQKCLELSSLEIKLYPMKDDESTKDEIAYVLLDSTQSKAELFLPKRDEGMLLKKTSNGNWGSGDYKLMAWKGYVVQFKGKAVFGGE